ncbi:unnamed protein product, partial [Meganyctiphanes norvegica]|uniref:C2H2-type domain-containing protein n=1 Tax=Meganyctiphanes norvegica TaxID=48144 RepID=A0AAV2SMH4_MEGNR
MALLDFHVTYCTGDGIVHQLLSSSLDKKIAVNDITDQNNNSKNIYMPWQCRNIQDDENSLKIGNSKTHENSTLMCGNSIACKGDKDLKSNLPKYKNISVINVKENNASLNSIYNYICSLCGYKCKYEAIFTDHLLSHGLEKNVQPNVLKESKLLNRHKCSKCNYKTTNKAMYNKHIIKSRHNTLSCLECKENFGSTYEMHKHKLTHALGSEFVCPLCDYKGQKLIELKKHLLKHSEKRLFKCSRCEFASSKISILEKHMFSHTENADVNNNGVTKLRTNGGKIKINLIQDYDRRDLFEILKKSGTLEQFMMHVDYTQCV